MKTYIKKILNLLDENYGKEPIIFLNYIKDYELLFATIMSAQCTDERVNKVTEGLFKKYNNIFKFAEADLKELEKDIFTTGFYKNKAKNIKYAANQLINEYNSVVPSDINELIKLAGVGRKTANIIRVHIYQIPSIVVDTHVKRVSYRLGLTSNSNPEKIEYDLMNLIPESNWMRVNSQFITLGRSLCKAKNPKCDECFLNSICKKKGVI